MGGSRKRKAWSVGVAAALASLSQLALADIEYNRDGKELKLYGILDAGVGTLQHSYGGSNVFASTVNPYNLNSSPNSFNGIFSGGISMSRWGVKGGVDLDHGRKVFFKLESAIDINSFRTSNNGRSIYNDLARNGGLKTANGASAIDGQPFSRAAYAGVSDGKLGSLQAGRTTNFSLDQAAEYDPVQNALLFSPLGFSGGIGGGLGATENTRLDNSLKYENKIDAVDLGLQYRFAGSDTDQNAESAYVVMLGYGAGPLSLKGTYSQTRNTVAWATQYSNAVTPNDYLQIENTSGYMLSAKYQVNPDATVKAGYEHSAITAPSNPNLTGIVSYYGLTLAGKAHNVTVGGSNPEQDFNAYWMGGDYKFSPAFDLAAAYYNIDTRNQTDVGKNYVTQAYSILADYTWNKYFDSYAGAMLLRYSGEGLNKYAPATSIYSSNAMYGAGLRFRF
jgi:GBP family porin